MRVVCENCGATYKIPDSKLVKEVNKATCRKCGFRMMIRRPVSAVAGPTNTPEPDEAATQVTANPLLAQEQVLVQRLRLPPLLLVNVKIVRMWIEFSLPPL